MEPELKTYLDQQFKSVHAEISDVLEVINDVKDNTATILERLDNKVDKIETTVEKHGVRLDKAEDSIRVIKTKLAV